MGYIERNLIPGEQIVYRTGLHWSVLIGPVSLAAAFLAGGIALSIYSYGNSGLKGPSGPVLGAIGLLLILAIATFLSGIVRRNSTEMAVTNKRVVAKAGLATRRTFELLLSKIESIGVDESLTGRMLGFGTVIIHGTGGTPETFPKIAHPFEFRKQVQQHIELYQQPSPPAPLG